MLITEMSHWDYIQMLARQEGFVSTVRGKEWYFGSFDEYYKKEALSFTWGHNVDNIEFDRAPNAARNLAVEIRSWHNGTSIIERASFNTSGHEYVIREYHSNITREQAERIARNKLLDYSRRQLTGEFRIPFSPDIDTDRIITLYGVGKGLSQSYFIAVPL